MSEPTVRSAPESRAAEPSERLASYREGWTDALVWALQHLDLTDADAERVEDLLTPETEAAND